jgi:hypothetical protein
MTPPKVLTFPFKELAAILVRDAALTEGHWGIHVRFGLGATNIGEGDELRPAAIIPVVEVGIQKFDEPNALTVDASQVNRARSGKSRSAS